MQVRKPRCWGDFPRNYTGYGDGRLRHSSRYILIGNGHGDGRNGNHGEGRGDGVNPQQRYGVGRSNRFYGAIRGNGCGDGLRVGTNKGNGGLYYKVSILLSGSNPYYVGIEHKFERALEMINSGPACVAIMDGWIHVGVVDSVDHETLVLMNSRCVIYWGTTGTVDEICVKGKQRDTDLGTVLPRRYIPRNQILWVGEILDEAAATLGIGWSK